jgi:hypothetical protein
VNTHTVTKDAPLDLTSSAVWCTLNAADVRPNGHRVRTPALPAVVISRRSTPEMVAIVIDTIAAPFWRRAVIRPDGPHYARRVILFRDALHTS